jgi:uncharacterized protein (DUF1330 family)
MVFGAPIAAVMQDVAAHIPENVRQWRSRMAKAYWVAVYHSVSDSDALAAYAKLAAEAIEAGGGRFLARGNAVKAYEAGLAQLVIIEFDSVPQAFATRDGSAIELPCRRSTRPRFAMCVSSRA